MNEEIAGLEVTSNNLDVPMTDSMAITRGRSLTIAQARRVAISAPDLDSITNPQHHLALNRRTQSNSTSAMNRIVFPSSDQSDSTDADPMDTDSDDDVDFWGGESPRDRALHASRPAPVEPGEESGDSSDEDENMEDDFEDDDDDDIDDPLQLFGHR